jgi:cytochrome c oxidase subunit 2
MLIVCALVFVLVMAALRWRCWRATRRPRGSLATLPDMARHPRRDSAVRRAVGWRLRVSTGVMLVGLLFASFLTDRAIARLPLDDAGADRARRRTSSGGRRGTTSTIRSSPSSRPTSCTCPSGRPVLVTLRADDVIHSFWVPSLHGKKD